MKNILAYYTVENMEELKRQHKEDEKITKELGTMIDKMKELEFEETTANDVSITLCEVSVAGDSDNFMYFAEVQAPGIVDKFVYLEDRDDFDEFKKSIGSELGINFTDGEEDDIEEDEEEDALV